MWQFHGTSQKRRGSGEPIQCAMVRHSSIAIIVTCYLYVSSIKKKDTSVTFWAERNFFPSYIWHFYDDNCDKTRYHHRCGGLLLLWQKIMTENCMTFFGPSMTEKTVVGGRAMRVSLVRTRVCARRWALTEPSDCAAGYALVNPSDRSIPWC